MSYELLVVAGPDKGRTFTLNVGADLMLGRAAHYQLSDRSVSRNHCQVLLEGDAITVVCNGSLNGTLVNGKKIDRRRIEPGDVLQVGDTQLRLQFGDHGPGVAEAQARGARPQASPASPATQLASLAGTTLAHFDINMEIGAGRTCVVFHATDVKDNRPVALKVLQPEFSSDEEEMQRFVRAMKTMLPLRHPNLVALYGAGKTMGYCWVSMEYVAGENMQQVIDRIGVAGMLDWRHAYKAAVHVARALEYAHGQSVVHRNVTPTNILLEATSKTVKLGDLLLAKALEGSLARDVTRPGEILGDVRYMSPERTRIEELDARSDLYGLGATLYALLTGRPPCKGASMVEQVTHIRQTEPEKPTKYCLSIPSQFEGVVMKLLAKRPDDRYQTATELLKELARVGKFTGAQA
jgi:serine/threonine protein kinase